MIISSGVWQTQDHNCFLQCSHRFSFSVVFTFSHNQIEGGLVWELCLFTVASFTYKIWGFQISHTVYAVLGFQEARKSRRKLDGTDSSFFFALYHITCISNNRCVNRRNHVLCEARWWLFHPFSLKKYIWGNRHTPLLQPWKIQE